MRGLRLISRFYCALEDLFLSYKIDPSHFAKLKDERLVEHTRGAGISIYDRVGQDSASGARTRPRVPASAPTRKPAPSD